MIETVINLKTDAAGDTRPTLLHLPTDYATNTGTFPLLVFLHGAGEAGTNLASIYGSATAGGPAYYIEQGQWPASYEFIVISPQYPGIGGGTTSLELDFILKDLVSKYRVDTTRIYITGLSVGGLGTFQYTVAEGVTPTYIPAAIVPMSMATTTPTNAEVAYTLKNKVNVWGFGSMTDVYGIMTHLYITGSFGGNNGPTPPALGANGRITMYTGGHCCWGQFYSPTYTESINGTPMNIYQWMLQYKQGAVVAPPVVTPPPVITPPAKTIKSVLITYSDGTTLQG